MIGRMTARVEDLAMLALSALSALLIGGLAASAAVPPAAAPASAPSPAASPAVLPGWLNARDFGASGSEYSTTAATAAGVKEITVADVGDFQVGQGVMVSECHPRVVSQTLWGPRHAVVMGRALQGKAELRGYDGTQGDWVILLIDIPEGGKAFRWSEDLARTWHPGGTVGADWQPLRDGLEVRFSEHDWEKGYTVAFSCRGQLVSAITAIDGTTVTLRDAASRAVAAATLRHCDDAALQAAIDEAVKTRMNLHLPNGRYRLSRGLVVRQPSAFTLEGAQAEHTILDISEGQGACITLSQGTDATLRRLTMLGHSGFAERDQCGYLRTQGSSYFWGFGAKGCNAVTISHTRRVLVEDCHGRRMATECFVSGSRSRGLPDKPTEGHSQSTVYLRCSAIDCGRNAFNDVTAGSENTSVIECRIVDVGGCAWEGASRFVKFVGNYVRNAGTVAMGNLGVANRDATFPALGAGQHLVANNIFESTVPYGGAAVRAAVGATQVHITHNTFVNFNSSAVHLSGSSDPTHYPTAQAVVAGNLFDMTAVDAAPVPRTAIDISAAQVLVADNQILVRGACDRTVTALRLLEPAIDITVHDNIIRNCGQGLACGRASSQVAAVIDPQTFTLGRRFLPLDHRLETQLQGWQIAWLNSGRAEALSTVEGITGAAGTDPVTVRLAEPTERLAVGRSFDALPPQSNWNLHDNTIADCLQPVVFDIYGSPTTIFRNNILTRGAAAGVPQAILVGGQVDLIGNHLVGFDEPGSAALSLQAAAFRQTARSRIRDNVFTGCAEAVRDGVGGLWTPAAAAANAIIEPAATAPAGAAVTPAATPAAARPRLTAPRANPAAPTLDGRVEEWPWQDASRVIAIAQPPDGPAFHPAPARACATWDGTSLYLAVRVAVPAGTALRGGTDFASCDGVELSLRAPGGPLWVLWGSTDSALRAIPVGDTTPAQSEALEAVVRYQAQVTPGEWTCEWALPLAALGLDADRERTLRFNLGLHLVAQQAWLAWQATGGPFYDVDQAGDLTLEPAP